MVVGEVFIRNTERFVQTQKNIDIKTKNGSYILNAYVG